MGRPNCWCCAYIYILMIKFCWFLTSEPILILPGTPGSSAATDSAITPWTMASQGMHPLLLWRTSHGDKAHMVPFTFATGGYFSLGLMMDRKCTVMCTVCSTDNNGNIAAATYKIRLRISTEWQIFLILYDESGDGLQNCPFPSAIDATTWYMVCYHQTAPWLVHLFL